MTFLKLSRAKRGALFIILVSALAFLIHDRTSESAAGSHVVREQTADYKIELEYPVIGVPAADSDMKSTIDAMLVAFRHDAKENRAYGDNVPPGDLVGHFNRSTYGDHIASYLVDTYIFTGGAHGNVVYISRTYDLKTGKIITLNDFFADISAALVKVMPMAKRQLMDAMAQATGEVTEPDASGLAPNEDNYGVFTIDDNGITFYFPPYQVYAYAAGPQHVVIPWASITGNLRQQWVPTHSVNAQ